MVEALHGGEQLQMALEAFERTGGEVSGSTEENKITYRELGDGGVEERLAIDDLALGIDAQVPPQDLHHRLPHACPSSGAGGEEGVTCA